MELDMKNSFYDIFEQFKLIDAFRDEFRIEFVRKMKKISCSLWGLELTPEVMEFLDFMAYETISFTETVIEKDRNYPEYRLVEELKRMNGLINKPRFKELPNELVQSLKFELNELILKNYPALYELSAFGYRLLDRNVNYFVLNFAFALYEESKQQLHHE